MKSESNRDNGNQNLYARREVVRHYSNSSALQPAEARIFERHATEIARSRVLDIGVGGGRTTIHLAPRASKYVGLDYSAPMITAARARFRDTDYEFREGDARQLPFADGSFTFVVFSHNGIDYVDHEDRIRVLTEIRRVVDRGGLFVFSTHNLARTDLRFEPSADESLWQRVWESSRRARLRATNPLYQRFRELPYAILNDGSFRFAAATYHIRVDAQLEQLNAAGFGDTRVYSGTTGAELGPSELRSPADPWLYFSCRPS